MTLHNLIRKLSLYLLMVIIIFHFCGWLSGPAKEKIMHKLAVRNNNLRGNATDQDLSSNNSKTLINNKTEKSLKNDTEEVAEWLPQCDDRPPYLGPYPVQKFKLKLVDLSEKYPEVYWGGKYIPRYCTAKHKVAIIVPYRDREWHLAVFLNHMHPFLMKQQIEYGIYIVEQAGDKQFNRAKLMNVGFVESQRLKVGGWQCFIFHDIDLLPLDTRNIYTCSDQPRHMSELIELRFAGIQIYNLTFGGVSAVTLEQFKKVNGFSNMFWGWGGEDDDMRLRLLRARWRIRRCHKYCSRYFMLPHQKSVPNPHRFRLIYRNKRQLRADGLSTLNYKLTKVMQYHLFTHILVNID